MADYNKNTIKAVASISKSINKKGEIKGKNKKETKAMKNSCPHHYYTRKGKLKPAFFNNSNGECVCELCKRSFPTKLETKDNMKEIVNPVREYVDQACAAAVSARLGEKIINKFVELKTCLAEFPKDYNRVMKTVSKKDGIDKKKKKHHNGGNGSNQFGSWGNNNHN